MKIVDAQIHLWHQNLPGNPAHRQITSYTAEDCLKEMDAGGVDAALIHPPGWDPNSGAIAEAAAQKYPDRFAILGNFPPDKPESRDLIAGWLKRPGMLGLRWAFTQPHQQSWMTDGTMDWVWPACEKAGIPVALMASNYLPQVAQIAERHPGLKLIIDHLGRARGGQDDAAFANIDQVCALAKFPNVALKATGAAGKSSQPYPFTNIHKYLKQLYDAFGPRRYFWGTDITRMPVLVEAVRDAVHRGIAVAQRQGPRTRHGPRRLPVSRLETAGGVTPAADGADRALSSTLLSPRSIRDRGGGKGGCRFRLAAASIMTTAERGPSGRALKAAGGHAGRDDRGGAVARRLGHRPGLNSPDLRALPVRAAGRENILVDADLGADAFPRTVSDRIDKPALPRFRRRRAWSTRLPRRRSRRAAPPPRARQRSASPAAFFARGGAALLEPSEN